MRNSDDDPREPITLESYFAVNHSSAVLSGYPIPIAEIGYLNLGSGLDFTGRMVTTEQLKQSTIALNESLNTKETRAVFSDY